MEKEIGKIGAEGLSFFGMTNRLISHELKNVLAIISETLGLIDEYMTLAEDGLELEAGKLRVLSDSIIEEIDRANGIIRNMNTFAHSIDEFVREVDINQIVALMIEIARLDSPFKNMKLRIMESDACRIHTSPFFLENLIFHILNYSLREAGPEKEIRVSIHPNANGTRITFSGIAAGRGSFPTEKAEVLSRAISAEISHDASAGGLHIDLPQGIGKNPALDLSSGR